MVEIFLKQHLLSENADINAAKVISKRAVVNQPIVTSNLSKVA